MKEKGEKSKKHSIDALKNKLILKIGKSPLCENID